MKFKIGDRVRVVRHTGLQYYSNLLVTGTVEELTYNTIGYPIIVAVRSGCREAFAEDDLELIEEINKSNMGYVFKEGDEVELTTPCSGSIKGKVYKLKKKNNGELYCEAESGGPGCMCQNNWKMVREWYPEWPLTEIQNNNIIKKTMNNVTALIKKLARTEPEKTFIEVGFLDESENITEDGKSALIHLLWQDKKVELKKLADELKEELCPEKK